MTPTGRWSLDLPPWVRASRLAVALAAIGSLAHVLPFPGLLAVALALVLWRLGQGKCLQGRQAYVELLPAGWRLHDNKPRGELNLIHVWRTSSWITLRFQDGSAQGRGGTAEATIWKASNSAESWRQLNLIIAARLVLPAASSTQGAQ